MKTTIIFLLLIIATIFAHTKYGIKQPAPQARVDRVKIEIKQPQTTKEKIVYYANLFDVDPHVALATAQIESSLNPKLINPNDKGKSYGLFQIHSSNLKALGHTPQSIMDEDDNILAGIYLLRRNIDDAKRRTKDLKESLYLIRGGYRAGEGEGVKFPELYLLLKKQNKLSEVKL